MACIIFMLKTWNYPKEYKKFGFSSLMIILEIIYLSILSIKLWLNRKNLEHFNFKHKVTGNSINIKKTNNLKIRLGFLIIAILIPYYSVLTTAHFNHEFQKYKTKIPLRKIFVIPIFTLDLISQIFYITICWIICSHFVNLNEFIQHLKGESERKIEDLNKIIDWFGINLKQISIFSEIFSFPLSCFFFIYVCNLMIAIEYILFHYKVQTHPIQFMNFEFILYKIMVLIYIVKQTADISKEAAKTSRFFSEYCLTKCSENFEDIFHKKVRKIF